MKVVAGIVLTVAVLLSILASINRHVVWQYDTTYLMWSGERAYMFVSRRNEGWSGNLLELAWEFAKGAARVSGRVTHRTWWLEVTQLSGEGVVRTVVPSSGPITPGAASGHIYATYEGSLSRWENGSFHAVAPEQAAGIQGSMQGGEFTDREGWSSLYNIDNRSEGERTYPIRLTSGTVEIIVNQRSDRRTVSAKFPDKPAEILVDLPEGAAWVDASTYAKVLQPPLTQ